MTGIVEVVRASHFSGKYSLGRSAFPVGKPVPTFPGNALASPEIGKETGMLQVAIIGSGPAGYYTAEALQKQFGGGVRIDVIDRLPTPFGLIRAGVAPDHQSIKAVSRRYEAR